jgi:hypothetical protein
MVRRIRLLVSHTENPLDSLRLEVGLTVTRSPRLYR